MGKTILTERKRTFRSGKNDSGRCAGEKRGCRFVMETQGEISQGAIFGCPAAWEKWLPPGTQRCDTARELCAQTWEIVSLTDHGCAKLRRLREINGEIICRILLVPGDCHLEALERVHMDQAVSYGLSARDSLTLSSLREPVLCIQRALPRPDGGIVEPQEIPLFHLPASAERLLPLLGLWLLTPRPD